MLFKAFFINVDDHQFIPVFDIKIILIHINAMVSDIVIKRDYVTFIIMEILKRSSIVDADDLISIDCNTPIPQLNDIAYSVARKSITAIDGSKRIVILCMKRGVKQ